MPDTESSLPTLLPGSLVRVADAAYNREVIEWGHMGYARQLSGQIGRVAEPRGREGVKPGWVLVSLPVVDRTNTPADTWVVAFRREELTPVPATPISPLPTGTLVRVKDAAYYHIVAAYESAGGNGDMLGQVGPIVPPAASDPALCVRVALPICNNQSKRVGSWHAQLRPEDLELSPESSRPTQVHPAVLGMLQFFDCATLPQAQLPLAAQFQQLAGALSEGPQNPETTVALRKLLEARDAALRAVQYVM